MRILGNWHSFLIKVITKGCWTNWCLWWCRRHELEPEKKVLNLTLIYRRMEWSESILNIEMGRSISQKEQHFAFFYRHVFLPSSLSPSSPRHPKCLSHLIACSLNIQRSSPCFYSCCLLRMSFPFHCPLSLHWYPRSNATLKPWVTLSHMPWDLGSLLSTVWIKILFTYPICLLSRLWASLRGGLTSLWIPGLCLLENECVCSRREIVWAGGRFSYRQGRGTVVSFSLYTQKAQSPYVEGQR